MAKKKKYCRPPKREPMIIGMVKKMYPEEEFIKNGFYSWLPSPRGSELQIDMFLPNVIRKDGGVGVAIEVQGRQHKEFVQSIHRTKKNFEYLKRCDRIKKEILEKKDIVLVEVFHNEKISYDMLREKLGKVILEDSHV